MVNWIIAIVKFLWQLVTKSWSLQRDFEKVRTKELKRFSEAKRKQNPHCGHVMEQKSEGIYHCPEFGCAQWRIEYQGRKDNE